MKNFISAIESQNERSFFETVKTVDNVFEWKVTLEDKSILGFTCYKFGNIRPIFDSCLN
jgi:hypothetical protein